MIKSLYIGTVVGIIISCAMLITLSIAHIERDISKLANNIQTIVENKDIIKKCN